MKQQPEWYIFRGLDAPDESDEPSKPLKLPSPPPWRDFKNKNQTKGKTFRINKEQVALVNAALYLRRPLLVTGLPGTGKSSLAYAVANELGLGEVLKWSITSRSTLRDGLYSYDAIGRLQASDPGQKPDDSSIGQFMRLGPLGTALADSKPSLPRVLLIDEIDKSDIDLPNDLLNIFEDGFFEIPELVRLAESPSSETASRKEQSINVRLDEPRTKDEPMITPIPRGRIQCQEFPFIVMTSNGERELPAPFLRRCLPLQIHPPTQEELQRIILAHFGELSEGESLPDEITYYIKNVIDRRVEDREYVATDQLLHAVYLILRGIDLKHRPQSEHENIAQKEAKELSEYILATISTSA